MFVELPTGVIHAEERGTGRPVLILHGGGLDHRHMLDSLEPVFQSTSGWKRVYIDLPGHGRSVADGSIASQDDVLGMIGAFIDRTFEGRQCALVGESRGSYHAMGLVHLRPDDFLGMMLVVAGGMSCETVGRTPPHQTLVAAAEGTARYASPEAQARFERLVVQSAGILDKIEHTKVPAAELADQGLAARIRERFTFSFDLSRPASPFDRPCLIVNGRQDSVAGYRDMVDEIERYPRATLAILDCAGHSLAWERPEVFKALTLDWLGRMEDPANAGDATVDLPRS